jgi:uncharacterized membrane protein YraQ (UPF0718 family)
VISGVVDVFVSSERIAKLLPKNEAASVLLCGLLGLIFPMCECGSVVVVRRFIKKGLPLSSAVTYMLAAPIVSPIVALSTFAAFKGQSPWEMTVLRLALGFGVASVVGLIVLRLPASMILLPGGAGEPAPRRRAGLSVAAAPVSQPGDFAAIAQSAGFGQKLILVVQSATADLLDVTFFLIIGAAVASFFNTAVNQEVIQPFATTPPVAIASLMALRSLLSICSTTDAFIVRTFTAFPFAAKLAALVFGPLFDFKLFWLYSSIFKPRAVLVLGVGLFVAIWLLCWRIATM